MASLPSEMMITTSLHDSGRDSFLLTTTSRPPSKWDSIEYISSDADSTTIGFATRQRRARTAAGTRSRHDKFLPPSTITFSGSNSSSSSAATRASSWKQEVSGKRPCTAPGYCMNNKNGVGVATANSKTPAGVPKKFLWGPKVACQREEMDRDIRRTCNGDPATFSL